MELAGPVAGVASVADGTAGAGAAQGMLRPSEARRKSLPGRASAPLSRIAGLGSATMAIQVAPGAGDVAAELVGGFVVQVTNSNDDDAAARALADARADITALATVGVGTNDPVLSNPVHAPNGPLLRVGVLDAEPDLVATVPDLVARSLERAGLTAGRIDTIDPHGPLDELDLCQTATILRVFPIPQGEAGVIPARWVEVAAEWVLGDLSADEEVLLRLLGAPFDVAADEAPTFIHHAARARAWCDLVQGSLADRIRTASLTFGGTPHLALAAGGPGCDDDALLMRYELLGEVARELHGEVAYVCIDFEPTFGDIGAGIASSGWRARGGASPNLVAAELADVRIPDVFPYQLLGPRHIGRLREVRPGSTSLERLDDGRSEVVVGTPEDWFPWLDERAEVQQVGWAELAPLLVTEAELAPLLEARPPRRRPAPGLAATAGGGQLDLSDIILEDRPQPRRGLHLTLLELVAWLAHERHSDTPESVSPVVAAHARWFASALDHDRRQHLKRLARDLVGTRAPEAPAGGGLAPEDTARAWLATDWLLRAQAPAWLRAAGLVVPAQHLEGLGPTDDPFELRQATDLLADVLAHPERADPSGGHRSDPSLAFHLVWEAWEVASEASGWVAASEAASFGVPPELAYAVELRVIECARDANLRRELTTQGRSMVDEARDAGWQAVAHTAWADAAKATRSAIDQRSRVAWASAFDRARRAAIGRLGIDDEAFDLSVETGERAAHRALADLGNRPRLLSEGETTWDHAVAVSRTAPGAEAWDIALDLAQGAVEDAPWEEGRVAATRVVDEILRDAPALVDRAVGAAFAREASGFAARELALAVAAAALNAGADEATAAARIADALAPTVDHLRGASLGLLEALIDAGELLDDDIGTPAPPPPGHVDLGA